MVRSSTVLFWASSVSATLNLAHFRSDFAGGFSQVGHGSQTGDAFVKRQAPAPKFLNDKTRKFVVNGTGIPDVDFDVGESYAGLLPIGDEADPNQLFFWFFPSTNPAADREIIIWITGGPGCSSVGELLQENGPFLWQPGTFQPFENKWSWHKLSNVVWIDQPVGTGFSQGTVTARNEQDVARQFMGFWKNFVTTFSMQGYKVYVTGSSYSGLYCPYIASAMLDANDKEFFNVSGMQLFDAVLSHPSLVQDIPAASFVNTWDSLFAFNDSTRTAIRQAAETCGYDDYIRTHLTYPPSGPQPAVLPGVNGTGLLSGCGVFERVFSAAFEANACFSVYDVAAGCPRKFDPLGFSDGLLALTPGFGPAFFNRPDVKAAINAPRNATWEFCASGNVFVDGVDESLLGGPGSMPVLPGVIERTNNVIIGHGQRDFVLIAEGTLMAIQNLTWGGQLGFRSRPTGPLYVPLHDNSDFLAQAGAGVAGTAHKERGLTYFGTAATGHFLSANAPAVAFRSLEILLGRVPDFQSLLPFTTDVNSTAQFVQSVAEMGNGTVPVGFSGGPACAQARLGDGVAIAATEGGASVTSSSAWMLGAVAAAAIVAL